MTKRLLLIALFFSAPRPAAWAQDPTGAEFPVNSYTTSDQGIPAVASDASGNFVVAWSSYGQDGSGIGVFGQRYSDLIFQDGFE